MHLIAAHSRFCAIEQARKHRLKSADWLFVTDEWVIKGHIRRNAATIGSDTIIEADCWRANPYEFDAITAMQAAGAAVRFENCGPR